MIADTQPCRTGVRRESMFALICSGPAYPPPGLLAVAGQGAASKGAARDYIGLHRINLDGSSKPRRMETMSSKPEICIGIAA